MADELYKFCKIFDKITLYSLLCNSFFRKVYNVNIFIKIKQPEGLNYAKFRIL